MATAMENKLKTLRLMGIETVAHNDWGLVIKKDSITYQIINIYLNTSETVEHLSSNPARILVNEHFICINRLIKRKMPGKSTKIMVEKPALFVKYKKQDLLERNKPGWTLRYTGQPGIEVVQHTLHEAQRKNTLINYKGKRLAVEDPQLYAWGNSHIVKGENGLYYFTDPYTTYDEGRLRRGDGLVSVLSVFDAELTCVKPYEKLIKTIS